MPFSPLCGFRPAIIYFGVFIWKSFLNDEFRVGGFLFSEMEQSVKDDFLETELMFTVYKPLSTEKKGRIFRNLNKTTDVNFIEMLNYIIGLMHTFVRFLPLGLYFFAYLSSSLFKDLRAAWLLIGLVVNDIIGYLYKKYAKISYIYNPT